MIDLVAAFLIGTLAAALMGMFVGRLESAFLDVGMIELAILYVYAGTQPIFRVLSALRAVPVRAETVPFQFIEQYMQPCFEVLLKGLACTFKLGLYVVVVRQLWPSKGEGSAREPDELKRSKLWYYMREQLALREKVKRDWRRLGL
jgi:hypothetical protein